MTEQLMKSLIEVIGSEKPGGDRNQRIAMAARLYKNMSRVLKSRDYKMNSVAHDESDILPRAQSGCLLSRRVLIPQEVVNRLKEDPKILDRCSIAYRNTKNNFGEGLGLKGVGYIKKAIETLDC